MWSFDVFDTCLLRRHTFPTDVFFTVGQELELTLNPRLRPDFAAVFVEARVEAERLALLASDTEEATLQHIWDIVANLIPGIDISVGQSIELRVEQATMFSSGAVVELVETARQRFGRVIYISDTYLPGPFVREQLVRHGFLLSGDECFVSSECGLTKRTGNLYRHLIRELKLNARQLHHYGDNIASDVTEARKLGINAHLVDHAKLTNVERSVLRRLRTLDIVKSSRIVGAMRAFRVSRRSAESGSASALAGEFVGPFLWILADWLLTKATQDEVTKLYFFSRDGCALHRIANLLVERRGLKIDCEYLYVSRQALLLPAVEAVGPLEMQWVHRPWEEARFDRVIRKLDLNLDECVAAMREIVGAEGAAYVLRSPDDWSRFWETLDRPPLNQRLSERIRERRTSALEYFRQRGVLRPGLIGIVDLGWYQSCQAAFTKLIRTGCAETEVHAYYLALLTGRSAYMTGMHAQSVFHRSHHDRRSQAGDYKFTSRIPLLEHVMNCAPHGTVHHYAIESAGKNVAPVCAPVAEDERLAKESLLSEVVRFAEQETHGLELGDFETRTVLEAILESATEAPNPVWAEVLQSITVADDQDHRDAVPLAQARTWYHVASDAMRGTNPGALPQREIGVWPELAIAMSSPAVKRAYSILMRVNKVRTLVRSQFRRIG